MEQMIHVAYEGSNAVIPNPEKYEEYLCLLAHPLPQNETFCVGYDCGNQAHRHAEQPLLACASTRDYESQTIGTLNDQNWSTLTVISVHQHISQRFTQSNMHGCFILSLTFIQLKRHF